MALMLDHFFVFASHGAPEAERLAETGLGAGVRREHAGQGTANHRFAELELLYINDESEALRGTGKRLRFAQRAADREASPFGLIFRDSDGAQAPPFASWRYYPDYFGGERYFCVGNNIDELREPACFFIPFPVPSAQPSGLGEVTRVKVSIPGEQLSPTLQAVIGCDRVELRIGEPHGMTVEYGGGAAGETLDMRPSLPLSVRW